MTSVPDVLAASRSLAALAAVAALASAAACGDDSDDAATATPTRTVEITANEYRFAGDPTGIVAGDVVRFVVVNTGGLDHELQVLTDGGRVLGRTGRIPPGGSDTAVVEFAEPGDYRLICDIDDHQSRGQFAFITVPP